MRTFEVTYNKMDGTKYGPLQFQINEPGDEVEMEKWWEKWPDYTPEYYAFVQCATVQELKLQPRLFTGELLPSVEIPKPPSKAAKPVPKEQMELF